MFKFAVMALAMIVSVVVAMATMTTPASPKSAAVVEPIPVYYGPNAFFYSRAEALPVDAALTTSFRAFMKTHIEQKAITWPKLNTNSKWAMSYDYGTASDPVWKLKSSSGANLTGKLSVLSTVGFHMSDSVVSTIPTGTQDRPVVVIDREFGYTVQFADAVASLSTHTIKVSNAGILWHGSNGLDYRNPQSNDVRNQTSRGRIIDAMVITREELDAAVAANTGVGHVLHLFFVETDGRPKPCFVHPMIGCENDQSGWGLEGTRIRIKPTLDLTTRGLSGAMLAIARTLKENGAYLGDNSGSATQIKMSQASKYTGTNVAVDGFKGKLTWDDFEVVQAGAQ